MLDQPDNAICTLYLHANYILPVSLPLFNLLPPPCVNTDYSSQEESEIDLYQARKCTDFKRMILNSLEVGDGVGVPVPLGYSDITDIEVELSLIHQYVTCY